MIPLKHPQNGETVSLLTEIQKKFLQSDRSQITAENFDYLNLNKGQNEDCSFPQPVRFDWESDGACTLQLSENRDFTSYFSHKSENFCVLDHLKTNTRYFWRVVNDCEASPIFFFDTANESPRFLKIEGITNVRDCGGWKTMSGKRIKQGLLYRGSEMNSHVSITENGLETMRKILQIKSVLDLRGSKEELKDVYGGCYCNIPILPYCEWFTQPEVAKEVFLFLAEKDHYPLYFHCWGGADRTGTLAFLLGALLGMSASDLFDDYEITTLSLWGVRSRNVDLFRNFYEQFQALEGASLQEKAERYFLSCGIPAAAIDAFRSLMLEENNDR